MDITNLPECEEHIKQLAYGLCEYNEDFEIIENPDLKYYDEKDPEYLRFPFVVRWYVRNSDRWLGKEFSMIMKISEDFESLQYEFDGYDEIVEDAEWIYLGYSNALETEIVKYKNKIEKLEAELAQYRKAEVL